MMRTFTKSLTALMLVTALYPAAASAALARVGPTSAANGFPEWFQDHTGVTLDFCSPAPGAELDEGWCLLLPADIPNPAAPEIFPTNFAGEHFWFAAGADGTYNGDRLLLVLAVEAAFASGETAVPGDQVVFGRLRIRVDNVPVSGTYKFTTPYGVFFEEGTAGERIFATRDLGLTGCVAGDFSCALNSDIGPFLLPSATIGGAELPPVTNPATGRRHIADPSRSGPVTGSPFGTNYFQIEGPAGAPAPVRIDNFSLMGRIFEGTLPARAQVDRASYSRTAGGSSIDGYATAFPTQPGRLPAQPAPAAVIPALNFYSAACSGGPDAETPGPYGAPVGAAAVAMSRNESLYFVKTRPATLPNSVCVAYTNPTNGVGTPVPPVYMPAPLGDQVFITEAIYNAVTQSLTVNATSSDTVAPPVLQVGAFGGTPTDFLTGGTVTIPGVTAPPSKVRVISSAGGVNELQVSTSVRPATGVTLTASVPTAVEGTEVTFTAQGQGSAGYQYRFWKHNGTDWEIVQDYSVDNTWVLPGTTPAGSYPISVHVRTSTDTEADATLNPALVFVITAPPPAAPTGVTLTPDFLSPQPAGTAVTFTAQGQGSTGYQYRFWLHNGSNWQIVQDYGVGSSWTLPATSPAGIYPVSVHVRTSPDGPEVALNPAIVYVIE
jgi:hypothetical protein